MQRPQFDEIRKGFDRAYATMRKQYGKGGLRNFAADVTDGRAMFQTSKMERFGRIPEFCLAICRILPHATADEDAMGPEPTDDPIEDEDTDEVPPAPTTAVTAVVHTSVGPAVQVTTGVHQVEQSYQRLPETFEAAFKQPKSQSPEPPVVFGLEGDDVFTKEHKWKGYYDAVLAGAAACDDTTFVALVAEVLDIMDEHRGNRFETQIRPCMENLQFLANAIAKQQGTDEKNAVRVESFGE